MLARSVSMMVLCMTVSLAAGCGSQDERKEAPVKTAPALPTQSSGPGPSDADAPTEFTSTGSGLRYRILRKSDRPRPSAGDYVKVNYRGTLDDGTQFDSSYGRAPASFSLRQVIPAWTEGVQLIGEGGMIELEVPSDLGYGDRGQPPKIPPKATLHFIIELIKIE